MAEVNVRVSDSGRLFPDAVVIKVDEQEIIAGQDGISPVVTVTEIGTAEAVSSHGYEVDVSDAAGVHTYSVYDGASAYAQAVAGGYSGTEEEFAADLIGFNTRAAEATAGATAAAAYADAASDSATAAATSESNAADSATAAASSASGAASSAGTATTAAGSASSSATAAAGSATTASNKASEAASSESNAASSATAASASATAAAASETAAASSASSAAGSATAAATSAAAIEEYEHDAEAWAIGKRGGVDVDSSDDTYHNNSKYYAEQAAASSTTASSAAAAASQSAQDAAASATAASQSEGNAASSATAAAGSATAAAGSASTASTAATTAQGHATNAASSATAASGSATAAGNAQTAAEVAQSAAEDAQDAAEAAQAAAEAVLASIPADYTELSDDVDDLKSALTGFLYSVLNGGTGTKQFAVNLSKNTDYVYTNLSSSGQSLSVVYTDDTTEQISGNVASNASVTINKSKDIKAVSGWYNASATFTIVASGLVTRVAEVENDISDIEVNTSEMDARIDALEYSNKTLFNITPSYSEIGYLTTAGSIYVASSARHTDFVLIEGYEKIIAEAYVPNSVYAIAFFTSNSLSTLMADSSIIGDNHVDTIYEVNIPSGAKYAMMSHLMSNSFIGAPKAIIYNTDSIENKLIDNTFNTVFSRCAFMAYHKFGVIGDSLSVGYTRNPITGQDSNRNIAYSWPQFLARMCGNIALNFGFSGLTSKTWLSSQYGYTRLIDSDNLCQGYILALGVNDVANLSLGTVDDIGTSADTFYRYYSDIITLVNNTAPNAHIFTFTMPYPITQASNNFNEAIRTISVQNQFDNVYLVDLAANYNDYFKDDRINGEKSAGHFSCIGYANIAGVMALALSDVMNANPNDFISIPFLPYGSNDILD